jgi:hypothetical protein
VGVADWRLWRCEDGAHGRPSSTQPRITARAAADPVHARAGDETLRELAPLLAEEGIDVDNIDGLDLDTLQAALNRAVERHNMTRFTPVGQARELAATTLRR